MSMNMTMGTSTTTMSSSTSTPTMTGMSNMATSTSTMNMAFNTDNLSTMLFSTAWMPTTTGHYVGTWFFLFFLAVIWRGLVSAIAHLDRYWARKHAALEIFVNSKQPTNHNDPVWRWSVNLPRAALAMVAQGVAYLLMIAVMTMNVGFFFAVVVGYGVGEFAFARAGGGGGVVVEAA